MTRLLSIDPGGTSGWSIWSLSDVDPLELRDYGQIEGGVRGFLHWWEGREKSDIVIAENFVLDSRAIAHPDLSGVRILGALEVLAPGFISPRNSAMVHAPDPFLRKHGLYINGQRHARDSIRHAVSWAKTTKHRPTLERFWPRTH